MGTVLGSSGDTWEVTGTAVVSAGRISQQNREKVQSKSSRPVYSR